jgi:hypothetical protein
MTLVRCQGFVDSMLSGTSYVGGQWWVSNHIGDGLPELHSPSRPPLVLVERIFYGATQLLRNLRPFLSKNRVAKKMG